MTGASGGIGGAVASAFVREGARVVATYRTRGAALDEWRQSLGEEAAERVRVVPLDVTEEDAVSTAVREVIERESRLDALVHCAGAARDALLLRTTRAMATDVWETNLLSAMLVARAALTPMLRRRYGRIVFVGSVVAARGNAGQAAYAAAKAGIEGLTRSLAREVGARGVTVNCVSPGFIETEMTAGVSQEARESIVSSSAIPRLGRPADVAHAALFLCEEASSFQTGTVLQVNGGLYM